MNDGGIESGWKQRRGKLKARWIKLTDDDLQVAADGSGDYLADKLQERYGIGRDEAFRQVQSFEAEELRSHIHRRRRPLGWM
jgi:uncharacterized protein YjbJ (UPF0337 family)